MKHPEYRNCMLLPNSVAHELYTLWKKTGDSKYKTKLDQHMKTVEAEAQALLTRYPSA
jgi:hypothetical protein